MTVDTYDPATTTYTVAGTGPYTIDHAYDQVSDLVVEVIAEDGTRTTLTTDDYSVSPAGPASAGDLTLTAGAASTHAGDTIDIARATALEQGWAGATPREKALEAQLDRMTMATQEDKRTAARSLRVLGDPIPPLQPSDGRVPIWDAANYRFKNGPSADEIAAAQENSETAVSARDKAEEWAENPENTEVETGKYSARHYAAKAAVFDPALYLAKSGNLSGLADVEAARTELGLGTVATQGADDVTLTGGTADGVDIGQTTPGLGAFTALAANGPLTGITGRLINMQVFDTAGAATYTPTAGTGKALIFMTGAGGGGGGADSDTDSGDAASGGGGGAGQTVIGFLDVSADGYSATLSIGAGGDGGNPAEGAEVGGTAGGDTTYSDGTVTWTADGGQQGVTSHDINNAIASWGGEGGITQSAAGALMILNGAPGGNGPSNANSATANQIYALGGGGGPSFWGGGGQGRTANGNGGSFPGTNGYKGSGGGGAATKGNATPALGGDGGDGIVWILEFSS